MGLCIHRASWICLSSLVVSLHGDIGSGCTRGYELQDMEKRLDLSGGVTSGEALLWILLVYGKSVKGALVIKKCYDLSSSVMSSSFPCPFWYPCEEFHGGMTAVSVVI